MNNTTTKVELVEAISENCNCTQLEARDYLETVLGIMKSTFSEGSDLKVVGFGTFKVQLKNDRIGRNPQTGEAITILSRRILSFKPSALLRGRINKYIQGSGSKSGEIR